MVPLMSFAAVASPPADPLGCDDPGGVLDRAQVDAARAHTASTLRADVRVRVEPTLDAGLDARMRQLRRQCPGWQITGDLRPDLVVVMFSQQEREAGVYYGADQDPRLEFRWEPAVDAMIGQFHDGEFTAGVIDGLETLTVAPIDPAGPRDPAGPTPESPQFPVTGGQDTGMPTTAILVLVLLLAGVAAVTVGRQWIGGGTSSSSNWWSNSRRYRSFGDFGSRIGGSSHSSHSGSHSSGGGAHRPGGGSKGW
jgi:hypothetical protein